MSSNPRNLKVGERVRYTRTFLQAISTYTGWYPQAKGAIHRIEGSLAFIDWDFTDGGNVPAAVNTFNLERCR